jgi:hypothetical protein
MEQELRVFAGMLATDSARIEADYFQLPLADADAVYRVRVYCYELYPQLRLLWGNYASEARTKLPGSRCFPTSVEGCKKNFNPLGFPKFSLGSFWPCP